jgi:hypothetical protein
MVPAPNRPTSFAYHIAMLFTDDQRRCMSPYLDLGSYDEVKANADAVFARLEDQSMPADDSGPWPDEWIALFRRWIAEGCPA